MLGFQLPPALLEGKEDLIQAAKNGDADARERIIEGHMRYAVTIAIRRAPAWFKEDAAAVALEAVVEAVDSVIKSNHSCLRESVAVRVNGAITDALINCNMISCSRETFKRHADGPNYKRKFKEQRLCVRVVTKHFSFEEAEQIDDIICSGVTGKYRMYHGNVTDFKKQTMSAIAINAQAPSANLELQELKSRIAVTEIERNVLQMLLDGFTGAEIARKFGKSEWQISVIRTGLKKKFFQGVQDDRYIGVG